jgi:hypothetical protein
MLLPEFEAAGDGGWHGIRETAALGWISDRRGKWIAGGGWVGKREDRAAWWGTAATQE